jgi:hypothetical protein
MCAFTQTRDIVHRRRGSGRISFLDLSIYDEQEQCESIVSTELCRGAMAALVDVLLPEVVSWGTLARFGRLRSVPRRFEVLRGAAFAEAAGEGPGSVVWVSTLYAAWWPGRAC